MPTPMESSEAGTTFQSCLKLKVRCWGLSIPSLICQLLEGDRTLDWAFYFSRSILKEGCWLGALSQSYSQELGGVGDGEQVCLSWRGDLGGGHYRAHNKGNGENWKHDEIVVTDR